MINSYYRDLQDPQFEAFKEEDTSQAFSDFMDKAREYLLEMYSCNFTQFLTQCNFPEYNTPRYWQTKMTEGMDSTKIVDDAFYEIQLEKQRKHILGNRY